MEIERDHYYWQLISPLHSLITSILETISRQPQTIVGATVRDYITLDLSLLLTHLARYSDIINDHSIGPDDATPFSEDLASIPIPPAPVVSAIDLPPAAAPVAPTSALDDLLGGVPPASPVGAVNGSGLSVEGHVGLAQADVVSGLAQADAVNGLEQPTMTDSLGPAIDVMPLMDEKYHPLYREAVLIAKEIRQLVQGIVFPRNDLAYLCRLNDCVRTLQVESVLNVGDNLKGLITEICSEVLKDIEVRARDILKEIDDTKPKLKLFMSGKQKQQSAKNELLSKELNELLVLPSNNWAEKNVHLAKALELLGTSDSTAFIIDLAGMRDHVESLFNQVPPYVIYGASIKEVMESAARYPVVHEMGFELQTLRDGSHSYWRNHQIVIKRWSSIVESLVHERGAWGELESQEGLAIGEEVTCSILKLMPRCNEFGMHEILVSDPHGTSHLDASVWKNEEEPEEEVEKTVGLRLSSLMRSSVEDTLNEEQRKELDQELLLSQSSGVKTLFTTDCELIVPMLAVRGKLELTTSTLSFTVSPDFEAQFKEQIAKQEAYRQSKKNEGVNKFTMLTLPENKIWRLNELTHEEYRLYSVGVGEETHE